MSIAGRRLIAASAFVALAAWPLFMYERSRPVEAAAYVAPVTTDYAYRDETVAFWERAVALHHRHDFFTPRNLSDQYLQRFRERGDIDDVLRAVHMAKLSLAAEPRANVAAESSLASAMLALHRFRDARTAISIAEGSHRGDYSLVAREASVDLEIGEYEAANRLLDSLPAEMNRSPDVQTIRARYLELTGHTADARAAMIAPTATIDSIVGISGQSRAWYHFRSGELAFAAGDNDAAIADETDALAIFPKYADALRIRARVEGATHKWAASLADATASADIVPYPETLGYKADAQRALGDVAGANETQDLIFAIARIGNTQRVSDRLIAIYESDHGVRTAEAYAIAKRELLVRDDVFTEDTIAWAAAADGKWDEAQVAIRKALRYGTQDARMHYHAGMIALHFGHREEARRELAEALAINPSFHPQYADEARETLAKL